MFVGNNAVNETVADIAAASPFDRFCVVVGGWRGGVALGRRIDRARWFFPVNSDTTSVQVELEDTAPPAIDFNQYKAGAYSEIWMGKHIFLTTAQLVL